MLELNNANKRLEEKREEITAWMKVKRSEVAIPIYGSVDIRDTGWKVGVVDANHFPAGFNNISEDDFDELGDLFKEHINHNHPDCQWVHIFPESHTRNQGYVENISTIKRLIERAGFRCTVGSPDLDEFGTLHGISGPLKLDLVELDSDGELVLDGQQPDLILLNNDLTGGAIPGLQTNNISPPTEMGWHVRRKSEHYACLKPYVEEIATFLDIDPWHMMPRWFVSKNKCLTEDSCRIKLAQEIDEFLASIQNKYDELGIEDKPFVVMKNDSGTYGLGILILESGDAILNLSKRKANKLRYAKGGNDVENFLIQEGIPTTMKTEEGAPVEPVVYLVGGEAAAWFYRINPKKSARENLNSPSAIFTSAAEATQRYGEHSQTWHALLAELSMLAMGAEAALRG